MSTSGRVVKVGAQAAQVAARHVAPVKSVSKEQARLSVLSAYKELSVFLFLMYYFTCN